MLLAVGEDTERNRQRDRKMYSQLPHDSSYLALNHCGVEKTSSARQPNKKVF